MEQRYWIGRKRTAMASAGKALSAEARLIHYDLAGRYSVMAAQSAAAGRAAPSALHAPSPGPRALAARPLPPGHRS